MPQAVRPVVVALCGDPGGANAVAPVIEKLRSDGLVDVNALAYRQAQQLWEKRSLAFDPLPESTTHTDALSLLHDYGAELLLTGTSINPVVMEKTFISAAREAGVTSLALLDFWSNYAARFSDDAGRLAYLPDRIAVMDERARSEMINEGFEPTRLTITGQPALDDLALWRDGFTPTRSTEIRNDLKIKETERFVLFASQPLSSLYGDDPTAAGHLGYTEQTVLKGLSVALRNIAERTELEIVLVIRPHPRESAADFESVSSGGPLRVVVSTEGPSRDLLMAADVVTGMDTMLLVESCYLGRPTVSLQPGLQQEDALPTNRSGHSKAVYREQDIEPVLEPLLTKKNNDDAQQPCRLQLVGGATQRVVNLVLEMMGLGAGMDKKD